MLGRSTTEFENRLRIRLSGGVRAVRPLGSLSRKQRARPGAPRPPALRDRRRSAPPLPQRGFSWESFMPRCGATCDETVPLLSRASATGTGVSCAPPEGPTPTGAGSHPSDGGDFQGSIMEA